MNRPFPRSRASDRTRARMVMNHGLHLHAHSLLGGDQVSHEIFDPPREGGIVFADVKHAHGVTQKNPNNKCEQAILNWDIKCTTDSTT